MKVAILGFDVEGSASYDYFVAQGHEVTICDQKTDLIVPDGAESQIGQDYLNNLDRFDVLVRTPGLKPSLIFEKNPDVAEKITTATNEFFKVRPTTNIIGVTGTKGKGTTSTLTAKILEAAGRKVFLGGNIGIPVLSFVSEVTPDDFVVMELSSFQLIDCKYSPNVAVCLMVVPEHLNWHADMTEYLDAKRQLFVHQTPEDLSIYNANNENSMNIVRSSPAVKGWYQTRPLDQLVGLAQEPELGVVIEKGRIVTGGEDICGVDELALLGDHNRENVCAAIAATWEITGRDRDAIRSAVTTFKGLPFRLELRAEKNKVRYYNDSFAATPDAAMAAIRSIPGMKIMILGGFDRGLDLTGLCETVTKSAAEIKRLLIIGASGKRLAEELEKHGYSNYTLSEATEMIDIVKKAQEYAISGDAVVLSPGFASFDMFKNFEERGLKFNDAVEQL